MEAGGRGRAPGGAETPDAGRRRVAELEAENAALRRALADARSEAERAAVRQGAAPAREKTGQAADPAGARGASAEAGARYVREAATGQGDPAASEQSDAALRRANAALTESRAALRESQERLRLILDSASDYAIFSMDTERRIASWNAGAERLLGWSEAEAVGQPADVVFTPEDREAGAPDEEAEGALRDGRAVDERWHQRKDGTRFWANGLMLPLRDPDAGPAAPPVGLLKVMRDETGKRRAEDALREAEDHLRHTVELNPQLPWTADPDGRITGFSERWLAVTGLSRGAAMGEGWMEVPHPEDRPRMVAAWARAVSTGESYDVEARLRMADGTHRWWRARAAPRLDAEGRVVRWYGTTEDIHDRKEAEGRLREGEARWRGLFERMHEGFALCEMVYGPDGEAVDYRHLELNAAWGRLTGVPNEAVQGRLVSEAIPGIEPFWLETYARVVETGEPAHFEYHLAAYGRWFEVTAYRTEPGRFAAIFQNVTERKRAEARRDALVELGDRLRDLRDPAEIARAAAEVIGRALGASRAGYGAVEGEQTLRVERDWRRGPEVASVAGAHRLSDYWTGFADDLRRGEVVAIDDAARDTRTAPRHAASYAALGIGAALHVPVVEAGRVAAILYVHDAAPRDWAAEEVAFVRGVADRAWAAAGRARAEAALAESEARWRGLFESMQEGLEVDELVFGPDGRAVDFRYLDVNPAWERHTGIPREAAVGRLLSEVVPGLDPFWLETYARVVETGEPAHAERFVPQLGRWYEARVHWTAGAGRFGVLVMDVTGRKAAEARRDALVELGDRLRDLRDPAEVARAAAEVIGRALGASRAGYGALDADDDGIRIERDWTGAPADGSVAGSHRLSDYWPGLVAALRRDGVVAIGDVSRDPRTAPHAARFAVLGVRACVHVPVVEGGRVAALLFVHDAAPRAWTEEEVAFIRGAADRAWAAAERARADAALRESEGHRRAALAAARLGTWEWDLATGAVALCRRSREIFGFRPGEGGRAPEVFGRVHPDDSERMHAEVRAAVGTRSRLDTEYRVCMPDGTVRAVAGLGDFVPGAAGRMLGVFADVTDRRLAEERRALLVNELNHRVKNTLAVVQSLALQTARGASDLPSFSAAFQARLIALARAHDLLTQKDWQGAPLGDVVRAALRAGGEGRVDVGPSSCDDAAAPLLAPAQALALALAVHELVTNALKHGALSVPGGRVSVRCRADPGDGGARVVEWEERGGPPIAAPPTRRGFGLRLLERGLAAQAGMAAELRFEPDGLRCALRLPPPAG